MAQYAKKGVKIDSLGATIYPSGEVWMPTNEAYLEQFKQIIQASTSFQPIDCLDIGTGSGILSFLLAKNFKKAKICGFDINKDAINTYNVNAASLGLKNAQAF